MKFYLTLLLLCIVGVANSQQTFPIELPTYNVGPLTDITIKAKVLSNNVYEYTIVNTASESNPSVTFTLRPNNLTDFKNTVKAKVTSFLADNPHKDSLINQLNENATLDILYFRFVSSETAISSFDDRPVAGHLYFGESVSPALQENEEADIKRVIDFKLDSAELLQTSFSAADTSRMRQIIKYVLDNVKGVDEDVRKDIVTAIGASDIQLKNFRKEEVPPADDYKQFKTEVFSIERKLIQRLTSSPVMQALQHFKISYDPNDAFNYQYNNSSYTFRSRTQVRELANADTRKLLLGDFDIKQVTIEFNEGFIENIQAIVEQDGNALQFENNYPIGFSSKRDYKKLYLTSLFDRASEREIPLTDILARYRQEHEVNRRDYSPANQKIVYIPENHPSKTLTLHKDITAQLFEVQVFSDFVGFDQNNPNGLIQLEFEKRLNINTLRKQFPLSERISHSLVPFVIPFLLKSKFEENNKYLVLNTKDQFTNNQYYPIKYTSTLELKRFENFSTGFDLAMYMIDFPSSKLMYTFFSGVRYGRVAIQDTVRVFESNVIKNTKLVNEFGVNTFQIMPIKAQVQLIIDRTYSVHLSWSLNFYFLRDNRFRQVSNIAVFGDENGVGGDYKYIYQKISFGGTFKPNEQRNSKLFFRYNYHWQQGYWRTGFHQAQVGYSFYLTDTLKK
jgi:hypothetical protein